MSEFYRYSIRSLERLETCHPDLQRLFNAVIFETDCAILCGHRGQVDQEEAFRTGRSKARWLESPHNYAPSLAVDVAPYPIVWEDIAAFKAFAAHVKRKAAQIGIKVRWGGDFVSFKDYPHWELEGWRAIRTRSKSKDSDSAA